MDLLRHTHRGPPGGNSLKSRVKRKLNHFAERYFTEQRLFLRNEKTTRFLRLTPLTQMGIALGTVLFFGWTIFASSVFLIDALSADGNRVQARTQQVDYETRLTALAKERDQRAREARTAQTRFYVALDQISAQQSALLASEDHRRELETGIEVIQHTLQKTVKERDRAEKQANRLLAELQTATGSAQTRFGAARETEATLDYLNAALSDTVNERDTLARRTIQLRQRVADLKLRAKLSRERNQRIFSRLEDAVTVSMVPLQKAFEKVGISTKKLLSDVRRGYSGIGGPLLPVAVSTKGAPTDPISLKANELLAAMDKVNLMRIGAQQTPLVLPLKTTFRLSSPFGMRRHPVTHKLRMHEGLDLAGAYGSPIYATADGVVAFAGWAGGYGRVVKIRHARGIETRYAHMSRIRVKKGQRVSQGDRIGDMGSSGRSTGSHVHYEIRVGGRPVNPAKYIKAGRDVF